MFWATVVSWLDPEGTLLMAVVLSAEATWFDLKPLEGR
jgi:hypothetical protein